MPHSLCRMHTCMVRWTRWRKEHRSVHPLVSVHISVQCGWAFFRDWNVYQGLIPYITLDIFHYDIGFNSIGNLSLHKWMDAFVFGCLLISLFVHLAYHLHNTDDTFSFLDFADGSEPKRNKNRKKKKKKQSQNYYVCTMHYAHRPPIKVASKLTVMLNDLKIYVLSLLQHKRNMDVLSWIRITSIK